MTSPIKPNLPATLGSMRRHATISGSLPRWWAMALIDRVEALEASEAEAARILASLILDPPCPLTPEQEAYAATLRPTISAPEPTADDHKFADRLFDERVANSATDQELNWMRETRPGRFEEDYLGDGAYVYMSPARDVVLYTSNGIEETNEVVLEPTVLAAFERWITRIGEKLAAHDKVES